jgi:hypothetical protein
MRSVLRAVLVAKLLELTVGAVVLALMFIAAAADAVTHYCEAAPGYVGLAVLITLPYGIAWLPYSSMSRRIAELCRTVA